MSIVLNQQVDVLAQRIKHHLITTLGKEKGQASVDEIYLACSYALREEIMMHWTVTRQTFNKHQKRTLYYLSMEYLPGRFLDNCVTNLCMKDLLQAVMKKFHINYVDVLRREKDPGLGNGGLGRLASCFLDSLAAQHYPACGYGLRYCYGMFEQKIRAGIQEERPDRWLLKNNPWEFRCDDDARVVHFEGKLVPSLEKGISYLDEYDEVRVLPYDVPIVGFRNRESFSVINLRLWSTKESPRNFHLHQYNAGKISEATENTTLTDVLYPNDAHDMGKRVRLKQEFLLVSASLQDIISHHLKYYPDLSTLSDKVRIQINDTHPALVIPEMMRLLMDFHRMPWKKAWEVVQECTSYTNHTILSEALEQWDTSLMQHLLPRQYEIIDQINIHFCKQIREKYPGDEYRVQRLSILENKKVRMAHLAFVGSHHVNGVAHLHTEILRSSVFRELHAMYPEKLMNITNGVTPRQWLLRCNPRLSQWITEKIGEKWVSHLEEVSQLHEWAGQREEQEKFIQIKKQNKQELMNMLQATLNDPVFSCSVAIDSLFDIQVKRIHEYKRQLMNALHTLILYLELKEGNADRIKRTIILGGKSAPGYVMAKNIIFLFYCIARKIHRDPSIGEQLRVIFIKNYNVSKAETIIPAANLSEQISTAGMEASGTGNMKFSLNGALTIGTEDGANVEMREAITDQWWPFRFGLTAKEVEMIHQERNYHPREFLQKNGDEIKIHQALEMLLDGSLTESKEEQDKLNMIYYELMEGHGGRQADYYCILRDLPDYYRVQKKVETLYRQPHVWAEYAIHNIASMGRFSSDVSIRNYAEKVWNITPCPADPEIRSYIQQKYMEHDRCKIPHK